MMKLKKFFKDTWKTLLVIFIVTATLLYSLIFDGSDIPFFISFMSAFVLLFLHNVKETIIFEKKFSYLKKSGFFTDDDISKVKYKRCLEITHANIFFCLLSGGWLVYLILCFTGVILI
ncbi:MAG: hypothetical protein K2K89_01225 [Ruminococcus sp.]|nr:hypothetical protein [Ruminococcus sp.]